MVKLCTGCGDNHAPGQCPPDTVERAKNLVKVMKLINKLSPEDRADLEIELTGASRQAVAVVKAIRKQYGRIGWMDFGDFIDIAEDTLVRQVDEALKSVK